MVFILSSCAKNTSSEANTSSDNLAIQSETDNINTNNDNNKEETKFYDNLKFFGRVYYKNDKIVLDHCGTGFELSFTGTTLSLDLESAPTTTLMDFIVDGEFYKSVKITRNAIVKISNDLENKEHIVRVIKSASTAAGAITINNIITDGTINEYNKEYDLSIEFVGDSITCGAGVLCASNSENTNYINSDVTFAYSYICANLLNAEYSMTSTEGICVKINNSVPLNSIDMYKVYSLNNRTEYPFNKKQDIVVINLGTNDSSHFISNPSYKNEFYNDYLELINLIRENNPDSEIICIYGHMWTNNDVRNIIKKVVSDLSATDNKIHYFQVSSDMNGGAGHPGKAGALKQDEELAQYIKDNILNK